MSGAKVVLFGAILAWSYFFCSQTARAQITDPSEVDALRAIKNNLVDPFSKLTDWTHGDPCTSNWTGLLRMNLSGSLAPELGRLSYMKILDVMWNKITGSIPKEIGNISTLKLLHMNNNSISGQIPAELSRLPSLVHLLLDNNNLSGSLPPELYKLPNLLILQLDNNDFGGSTIPATYSNMTKLLKLSLRNCNLQGAVPDLSGIPKLGYLDLSGNRLTGPIPSNRLSDNVTTIDLSNNFLSGSIPLNFSGLPNLQRLSLNNNNLSGSVPPSIWKTMNFTGNRSLIVDFQDNSPTNISDTLQPPANVTILLHGNPVCAKANQLNIVQFCRSETISQASGMSTDSSMGCGP